MKVYLPEYFALHELVPPEIYDKCGTRAWQLLDDRLLYTQDRLRNRFGKMKVNDYFWGGEREWSGLRTPDSPFYSRTSQHSFGRATDNLFSGIEAEEVRAIILRERNNKDWRFISSIELGTDWLHYDVRNVKPILTFYPETYYGNS